MQISGAGISSPITVKVLPGFRPKTKLAFKHRQTEDGNYTAIDRGSYADVYEATIQVYGKIAAIDELIDAISDNREYQSNNQLTLSSFFDTEYIFGEDVDHSGSITATVLEYPTRKQNTWKGFGVSLKLRAVSVSFTGSATFPTLSCLDIGYSGDRSWTINKYDDYSGNFTYIDNYRDSGIFQGVFTLTKTEMQQMRRYIATQRTGNYTLADTFGVDYPFGQRTSNSYPYTCKLIEWEDLGMWGLKWNKIKLTFAEVI